MEFAATDVRIKTKPKRRLHETWLLIGLDLLIIYACFAIGRTTNWVVNGLTFEQALFGWQTDYGATRAVIALTLGIACLIMFARFGHYDRRRPFWQELGDILGVVVMMAILDAALVFLTKTNFSRLWWGASWSLVAILVPTVRYAVKQFLMSKGAWLRPTVIIGVGPNAQDTALALESEPLLGFNVVAFIQPSNKDAETPGSIEVGATTLPVLPSAPFPDLLPSHLGRPHVVVAMAMDEMVAHASYVERLSLSYSDVDIISPMRGLPLAGTQVTHFFTHDVLALRLYNSLSRPWPRRIKRCFDLAVGCLLLLFSAPLFALIGWRLARKGGPVFFGHIRIGKGGRRFKCLKFRTMVPDADRVLDDHLDAHPEFKEEWETHHKLRHDPRITRMGKWLRRTSLDELPQLINVIKGEMSLVGPRPVVADELDRYGDNLVYYVESKPGLTGLWQVSGRSDVTYRQRVHLDSWYVRNWSLWCDLVILIKTPKAVLKGFGAY
ncbi:MAG: undecaprenyl-phosphate galactose phosphotransferase WbaP [Geminicoccales bacterium]